MVVNPSRGLLDRGKKRKKKVGQRPAPLSPRALLVLRKKIITRRIHMSRRYASRRYGGGLGTSRVRTRYRLVYNIFLYTVCCIQNYSSQQVQTAVHHQRTVYGMPTRKKLLYTVVNPARGLLNRGKKKEKLAAPPPPRARCSFGENKKSRDASTCLGATQPAGVPPTHHPHLARGESPTAVERRGHYSTPQKG